jgi:hypothetical protein
MKSPRLALLSACAAALFQSPTQAQTPTATGTCRASSGATSPVVVELYTSEGCSSCPPADKWLSTLKGRPDILALAFHVNYWDRLGWPDRFASPEITARQHQLAQLAGSRQVYTPQVVAAGRDWRVWPQLPPVAASRVNLTLSRDGDKVTAQVSALAGTSSSAGAGPGPGLGTGTPQASSSNAQLGGYWAVLEDQHLTRVKTGENSGETLRHDHVVRLYKPVPPWLATQGYNSQLTVSPGVPEHPRRVVFVVTEGTTQRPVQALALSC